MSNLPIAANAAQASAKPAPAAPQADNNAPQGQPFGDVLARQVSDAAPATAESTASPKKINVQTSEEIFSRIKKSNDAAPVLPGDATAAMLPADMLAALLPQNMATTKTAAPAEAQNTLATAATKADLGMKPSLTAPAAPKTEVPADSPKDAAFTGMMETMSAAMTNKLSAADEKLAAIAAAPQPTAAVLASMQATTAPLTPANVMPTQVTINTPVAQDKWGDEFNQKITWLATSKEQSAELHLNPPQLGPMDVVLKVSGDQATALFTSPHAAVRDAIEQALPKLREMMADNGIMLGNATVSDQAPRNGRGNEGDGSPSPRAGVRSIADTAPSGNLAARVSPIRQHNGIVDTFA